MADIKVEDSIVTLSSSTDTVSGWVYDGSITSGTGGTDPYSITTVGGTTTWDTTIPTWSTAQWTIGLEDATPEELSKIMKNLEVQIEIGGELKKAKLSDLLKTGYLKLKQL